MKLFLEWQAKNATQIGYLYRLQIYKKTEIICYTLVNFGPSESAISAYPQAIFEIIKK